MLVTARRTLRLERIDSELAKAQAVPAHGQPEPNLGSVASLKK